MDETYDLIIVGGGIGGSALATVMARAGKRVLVLEASEVFEDHVRGEWIAPWGVTEVRRLGLYDLLVEAGGHHIDTHRTFDETHEPDAAPTLPLGIFAPDVPGPLALGHPRHCQTLFDAAGRAGATMRRGVEVTDIVLGAAPRVAWRRDGVAHEAAGRLVVGADGRTSMVREACGVELTQDPPHHMFAGMLVEGASGWDEKLQAIGTENDFNFLAFPQGGGKIRVYGSFSIAERRRFSGPEGPRRFLDAFRLKCSPANRHIAEAEPAGPVLAYFNNSSATHSPYVQGAVLIGDAAGWNDPIIGLGLSITYRDVRLVSDLLLSSEDWTAGLFDSYGEERRERMRRLQFVADLTATLDAEFGEGPKARRRRYFDRAANDPTLSLHQFAIMAGPETAPPETFTPAYRARVLEG